MGYRCTGTKCPVVMFGISQNLKSRYESIAVRNQSKRSKSFASVPTNSRSTYRYKYMRFKHFLGSRYLLNFLDSYSTTSSIKRDYRATNYQSSNTMSKAVSACSTLPRYFPNFTQSAPIKNVPTIESVHTLCRPHEYGNSSIKSSNLLHNKEVLRQKLYFGSSAITNIEDSSDSSSKPNIFKRIYKKVMPEGLRVSKSTLYRGGATLSACCTHQVNHFLTI